ncbi:hypothetical protein AVEN_138503-1 [Araneus ventricosus]|uniref:Uncharacterized protein n=1 Tax=Araneus ventricosus TaxID=182803 RepID=A0A4Y2PS54_ARAVE|nr:hypothetical protein AVEN_138503-1 [Araneus ventricosus]
MKPYRLQLVQQLKRQDLARRLSFCHTLLTLMEDEFSEELNPDLETAQFYRIELKTKRQKPVESFHVLSTDVEQLMRLTYAECPLDFQETLGAQYFVDAIRDEDTQHSTRMMQKRCPCGGPTLVDLKREAISARVLNLETKPKTVDKRTAIETCEQIGDIVPRPEEFSEAQNLPSILENLEGLYEKQPTAVRKLHKELNQ